MLTHICFTRLCKCHSNSSTRLHKFTCKCLFLRRHINGLCSDLETLWNRFHKKYHTLHVMSGRWVSDPFFFTIFYHNPNLIQVLLCCKSNCIALIATKFCIWHENNAILPCVKFWSNLIIKKWITAKRDCYQIQIVHGKSLVKWFLSLAGCLWVASGSKEQLILMYTALLGTPKWALGPYQTA